MDIDPSAIHSVQIFPPIGIARVGNSHNEFFYGPEIAGRNETPQGGFKDGSDAVKRQAARFRVYGFNEKGKVLGELNCKDGFNLEWTVEVANKKASWYTFQGSQDPGPFQPGYTTLRNPLVQATDPPEKRDKLIVNPGPAKIAGPEAQPVPLNGKFTAVLEEPVDIYLGELRTDETGRLVFLAGRGFSHSVENPGTPFPLIMNDFDSANWIDDTCDGSVTVVVSHPELSQPLRPTLKASVIGTTPKFVSEVYAPTSLYDLIEDIYERPKREAQGNKYECKQPGWYEDIWPLLQRPALLSWVNGQANGGHGPNGHGNFFTEDWQKALSDPSDANKDSRMLVLGRMRLPDIEKNRAAREGQAYPYFMPWLSGDGGRATAGDPSTFASVTELQYDRLVKWANGDFYVTSPPPKPWPKGITLEDIRPVALQPAMLARANLEWTIGAPLYPGIEMSWNAELSSTYDFSTPFRFRIAESVQPGDLTKYLSLPWQSDFYMCRSYWWPSARPDAIVTEDDLLAAEAKQRPGEDLAKALTSRKPWERGLRVNYTDVYGAQPLFANTDMAVNWHKLGFIVKKPDTLGPTPIFYETQRGTIDHDGPTFRGPGGGKPKQPEPRRHGGYELPRPNQGGPPITTLESLQAHLQAAMAVELSTIPLYLFAMYSVKTPKSQLNNPRYYDPVTGAIRGVVAEEMLHLSLAGNTLLAINGHPKLYDKKYIPVYPMPMTGHVPELTLSLRAASKLNLQTFVTLEEPKAKGAQPESDRYHTLGQFYDAIILGLNYVNEDFEKHGKKLFNPERANYQFAPGLGYSPKVRDAGGSVVIDNLTSALKAMTIIIDQGEGRPDDSQFDDNNREELSHYATFNELMAPEPLKWDCYPVRENPITKDYKDVDKRIYHVSLTFDAAYCYLLLTIERLWSIEANDKRRNLVLGNMYGIMMGVLAPLAKFLVQQPIGNEETASPSFGFYDFYLEGVGASPYEQLQYEMQAAINAYINVTEETPDQVTVNNYGPQLDLLLPIQASIQKLVDLNTFQRGPGLVKKTDPGVHSSGYKGFGKGS